jgi:hypothetical protein
VCVTPPGNPTRDVLSRLPCASLTVRNMVDPSFDYCDSAAMPAAPNLGCFNMATPPQQPTSMTVTVWGVVDVLGTGSDTNGVNVQFFEVNSDGTPGTMVGQATSDASMSSHYTEPETTVDASGGVIMSRTLGSFVIPGIMTDHRYIVRTQGAPTTYGHAVYDYTIAIHGTHVNMPMPPAALSITGPAVYLRPRAISNSDWVTLPSFATLTSGIPTGHGAIAGEVHDCDDVRLANATLYSEPQPNFQGTVYFSDSPTMPIPDTSRATDGTALLGIWALLDLNPGPVRISALGYQGTGANQQLVHVGSYSARVFADSVTLVVLRGLQPWQVPH